MYRIRALLAGLVLGTLSAASASAAVLYGFTNFPHDLTPNAAAIVHARTIPNSTLYAQHMDQCVPWYEVLSGAPFPAWLRGDFDEINRFRSPGQTMYVAVTPTANDRQSVANACVATEGSTRPLPSALRGAGFDSPALRSAYLAYVRRVADALQPKYMNVAIEISELALKSPGDWAAFDGLFRRVVDGMHQSHPGIAIGLELVVQSIMKPEVGELVRATAEYGDYIGLSFYPYGSGFGEIFGAPALPAPPDQWKAPLDFVRAWTNHPLAMAETGYVSRNQKLAIGGGLTFTGSPQRQAQFLEDVIRIAVRDNYLFFVWFVPIDYTNLLDKMRLGNDSASSWLRIWQYTGLWDADLKAKPALVKWSMWKDQGAPATPAAVSAALAPLPTPAAPEPARTEDASAAPELRCSSSLSTTAPADDRPAPSVGATAWNLRFGKDWELCTTGYSGVSNARGIHFWTRSSPADMLLVQVEEADGDAYYALVESPAEWREARIAWKDFKRAPSAPGNGRLDPEAIVSVTFGEGSGADGRTGSRRILLSPPLPLP